MSESLSKISWRRFTTLLGGLSRNSVFIIVNDNLSKQTQEDDVLSDEQGMALLSNLSK